MLAGWKYVILHEAIYIISKYDTTLIILIFSKGYTC
jgi:hypothetical protein